MMINKAAPTIRIATSADACAIALIHIRSWQKMYQEFVPEAILKDLSLSERTQLWQQLINQNARILVIEIEQQLVGFAHVGALRDDNERGHIGEIIAIYLHPDYWRQGLGCELCEAALAELKNSGYGTVCLWVLEDNSQARRFYEVLGFVLTSETKLEEFYEGSALLKEVRHQKTLE